MKVLILGVTFLCLSIAAGGEAASIVGSYHDLSWVSREHFNFYTDSPINDYQQVCIYCHTPHNATVDVPLWNREQYEMEYTPYSSSSLTNVPGQPSKESRLCLSCHDGTIAVDAVVNIGRAPGQQFIGYHGKMTTDPVNYVPHTDCYSCHRFPGIVFGYLGNSFLSTDLSNDHPITMAYPDSPRYQPPSSTGEFANGIKLIDGKVECASCHDVHNPEYKPFLRTSNAGSQLCSTCHVK